MKKSILNLTVLNIVLAIAVAGCDSNTPVSTNNQASEIIQLELENKQVSNSESVQNIVKIDELQTTKSGLKYQIHSSDKSLTPKIIEYKLEVIDDRGNVLKEFKTLSLPLEEMMVKKQFGLPVNNNIYPVVDTNGLFIEGLELIKQFGIGQYTLYLSYTNNIPPFSNSQNSVIPANAKLKFNINAKIN